MSTRTIYCDESGFTGYNLLDPQQPIFAVASAGINEEEAAAILSDAFPRYNGVEYKFSNIWRSSSRPGLTRFCHHLQEYEGLTHVYVIDKKFGLLTKIVDFLIEPYITDAGYDFYDEGFCWKYANYIHFGFSQFAPPDLLHSLLRMYQEFSRAPTLANLDLMEYRLGIMAASAPEEVSIFFQQMELGAKLFTRYHSLSTFREANELQVTAMIAIVGRWRQRYTEDFEVVHDDSSNFLRGRDLWERITNDRVPRQMHRVGDGSFVEFPLRVVSTRSVDSSLSRSIQLCDVLAGLATKFFDPNLREEEDFLNGLIDAGLGSVTQNGIRPDTTFPDRIPPKRLSGPDVVDQMTAIIHGSHNDPL